MKTTTMLIILLLSLAWSTARGTRTGRTIEALTRTRITGQVMDNDTRKPFTNATVGIFSSSDSTQVAATITNQDGKFCLSARNPASCYLRFSYPGYAATTISLNSSEDYQSSIQLGIIFLQKQEQELVSRQQTTDNRH
jgi:hypothetical protein